MRRFLPLWGLAMLGALALGGGAVDAFAAARQGIPSRSMTIALTSDDGRLVVVNRETNSVSIIRVRSLLGGDAAVKLAAVKLAEVAVGQDPRCVAISPDDREAFVTNGAAASPAMTSQPPISVSPWGRRRLRTPPSTTTAS